MNGCMNGNYWPKLPRDHEHTEKSNIQCLANEKYTYILHRS